MKIKLTPKQQETLECLQNYISKHGEAPTIEELRKVLGLSSLRSVTQRLESLESKGFIKKDPFKHKGISILDPLGREASWAERVPVIASAGCDALQVYAEQNYDEFLVVDKKLLDPRKELVAIRAVGNSMVDAGIKNGDYVLLEVTDDVKSGDLVVAVVGDMAVIKRLFITNEALILKPESKSEIYQPIILKDGSKIFGKVVRTIKMRPTDEEYTYEPIKAEDR